MVSGQEGEAQGKRSKTCKSSFCGKILILLDPHNLSVRQILPKYYIAIFANCHCHLPFLASLKMANFDVQISYGGLKVSEFYQESISDV